MTVPGVSVITASTFVAAIGDIRRFRSARQLVGYLGLDPRVRQSGRRAGAPRPHHQAGLGRGPPRARRGGVDRGPRARPAARLLRARARPPRRAGRDRRDRAQARQPVLVPAHPRAGLRLRPAVADAPRRSAGSSSPPARPRARARSAPATAPATRRSATPSARSPPGRDTPTAARSPTGRPAATAKAGASVTPGRASQRPSKGKAARQTTSP